MKVPMILLAGDLGRYLPVICMAKNMPQVSYRHQAQWVTFGKLYARIRKRPSKARILASGVVESNSSNEIKDLSLIDALQRLLALDLDKVRSSGRIAEVVVFAMIDSIMGTAIEFIQSSRRFIKNTVLTSIG